MRLPLLPVAVFILAFRLAAQDPTPTRIYSASYPRLAASARIDGDVVVEAITNHAGKVAEVRLVRGHPLLVKTAKDNLQRWFFDPKNPRHSVVITYHFQFVEAAADEGFSFEWPDTVYIRIVSPTIQP